MNWIWDENKENQNIRTHGISFGTATRVFEDPLSMTKEDPYWDEPRWRTMGMIGTVVVVVIHTMPIQNESGQQSGRIISARKATKHERKTYENERR